MPTTVGQVAAGPPAVVDPSTAGPAVRNAPGPEPIDEPVGDPTPPRTPARVGPVPPGVEEPGPTGAGPESPIRLPPGWYGNPNNPDRPVQWWDGRKLVDRPGRPGR